jgi:hypothetical protein
MVVVVMSDCCGHVEQGNPRNSGRAHEFVVSRRVHVKCDAADRREMRDCGFVGRKSVV